MERRIPKRWIENGTYYAILFAADEPITFERLNCEWICTKFYAYHRTDVIRLHFSSIQLRRMFNFSVIWLSSLVNRSIEAHTDTLDLMLLDYELKNSISFIWSDLFRRVYKMNMYWPFQWFFSYKAAFNTLWMVCNIDRCTHNMYTHHHIEHTAFFFCFEFF